MSNHQEQANARGMAFQQAYYELCREYGCALEPILQYTATEKGVTVMPSNKVVVGDAPAQVLASDAEVK